MPTFFLQVRQREDKKVKDAMRPMSSMRSLSAIESLKCCIHVIHLQMRMMKRNSHSNWIFANASPSRIFLIYLLLLRMIFLLCQQHKNTHSITSTSRVSFVQRWWNCFFRNSFRIKTFTKKKSTNCERDTQKAASLYFSLSRSLFHFSSYTPTSTMSISIPSLLSLIAFLCLISMFAMFLLIIIKPLTRTLFARFLFSSYGTTMLCP